MLNPAEGAPDGVHTYGWWQDFDNPAWEPPTTLENMHTPVKGVNGQKPIAFIAEVEVGESRGNIRRVRDGEAEMIIGVRNGRFTWIDGVVETGVPRGIEGRPGHKIQSTEGYLDAKGLSTSRPL